MKNQTTIKVTTEFKQWVINNVKEGEKNRGRGETSFPAACNLIMYRIEARGGWSKE